MRLVEIQTSDQRKRYVVIDDDGVLVAPIARYLKHLDQRGYARNTLRSYGSNLKLFFDYLAQKGLEYGSVTLDDLAGFVHWLKLPYGSIKVLPGHPVAQARANATINTALKVVSGFYDYLWRTGNITDDRHAVTHKPLAPWARSYKGFLHHLVKDQPRETHLLKQATAKRRPKALTNEQVARLIAACHNPRDRLLLGLLCESALRVGEALALWLEDIDVASYRLLCWPRLRAADQRAALRPGGQPHPAGVACPTARLAGTAERGPAGDQIGGGRLWLQLP